MSMTLKYKKMHSRGNYKFGYSKTKTFIHQY